MTVDSQTFALRATVDPPAPSYATSTLTCTQEQSCARCDSALPPLGSGV